jgi:NAD(P)H-dependent FMN reductase
MSQTGNIIVFSGSLRDHSINVMLAKSVVNELESDGVSSTFLARISHEKAAKGRRKRLKVL